MIDSKNNIDQVMDVAISQGKIAAVKKNISAKLAKKMIDAKGLMVSPGLIDIHSHNFHGTIPDRYLSNSFASLPPDGFTFRVGVTTLVDCGDAGWRNFKTFKDKWAFPLKIITATVKMLTTIKIDINAFDIACLTIKCHALK